MWPEERAELELELRPIEKADENTKTMPYFIKKFWILPSGRGRYQHGNL